MVSPTSLPVPPFPRLSQRDRSVPHELRRASVSTPRSANRTCGFAASGSRRRLTQSPRPLPVTLSATSENNSGVVGLTANLPFVVASCVRLQLRRRVGPGNCTPSHSQIRTLTSRFIRLVSPLEGCRLPPESVSSSGFPLTLIDPDASNLLPSLHGHYPTSTLVRSSPPLAGASVLSALWGLHLRLFPCHRQLGSQVPHEGPD